MSLVVRELGVERERERGRGWKVEFVALICACPLAEARPLT